MWSNLHANSSLSLTHSKVVVSQNAFIESLVRDSPRPGTPSFATEQALGTRRLLEHAVLLHRLHFVAGGVREEMLEVLIFEGEGVACDAFCKTLV
jgi:hypothetical protein